MIRILRNEIAALDTSRKALRSFGLLVGGVTLAIALILIWRSGWTAETAHYVAGATGCFLMLAGAIMPQLLRPVYVPWMALAVVLGFIMTRVILTVVFYAVVTPIGLIMRIAGRDPLDRKRNPAAPTYWIDKSYSDESPKRLEKYY